MYEAEQPHPSEVGSGVAPLEAERHPLLTSAPLPRLPRTRPPIVFEQLGVVGPRCVKGQPLQREESLELCALLGPTVAVE